MNCTRPACIPTTRAIRQWRLSCHVALCSRCLILFHKPDCKWPATGQKDHTLSLRPHMCSRSCRQWRSPRLRRSSSRRRRTRAGSPASAPQGRMPRTTSTRAPARACPLSRTAPPAAGGPPAPMRGTLQNTASSTWRLQLSMVGERCDPRLLWSCNGLFFISRDKS